MGAKAAFDVQEQRVIYRLLELNFQGSVESQEQAIG